VSETKNSGDSFIKKKHHVEQGTARDHSGAWARVQKLSPKNLKVKEKKVNRTICWCSCKVGSRSETWGKMFIKQSGEKRDMEKKRLKGWS